MRWRAGRRSRRCRARTQMAAVVEATVVARRAYPAWRPDRIGWQPGRDGVDRLPGLSSVYRALVGHGLVGAKKRRRRREEYRRWERSRSMELRQMDVVGRVHLAHGRELMVVTGIDDHARFVWPARRSLDVRRRGRCARRCWRRSGGMGIPEQLLTDNGKVFTARFGLRPGPVMFDKV